MHSKELIDAIIQRTFTTEKEVLSLLSAADGNRREKPSKCREFLRCNLVNVVYVVFHRGVCRECCFR